jgi:hypothetical protein
MPKGKILMGKKTPATMQKAKQATKPGKPSIYKGTDNNSKGPKMPATANGKYVGGGPTYKIVDNVRVAVNEQGKVLADVPKNKIIKPKGRKGMK